MFPTKTISICALIICIPTMVASQTTVLGENTLLPSEATQQVIKDFPVSKAWKPEDVMTDYRQFTIKRDGVPQGTQKRFEFDASGSAEVPIASPNTVIVQFEPETSEAEIQAFIDERNLKIVRTFSKIGAVQLEGDLSAYFRPQLIDNNANDALLRGLISVITDFQSDPRIRSATPDLVLSNQTQHGPQITNLFTPSGVVLTDPANATETTDWGIADIQADQLWGLPGATDGVLLGVMDVGFTRHEDLVFIDLPPGTDVNDHGNHVAAIACAQHGNGIGVRGVLPNCFVRARSGDVFFNSTEGSNPLNFLVLFSQILVTLERFVDSQDEVRTFNISLGYNWRSNFGINPDLPDSAQWRTLVASQGVFLVPLLELADQNGRILFSAAGNDSSGLATPIGAKFASPFNWAAVTAREKDIAHNGVIVEAHDANGQRAPFSNTGGHISCPGVNIFSAIAFDPGGQISRSAYGSMSGTSMASPYCASGQLLFRLVRPGYDGVEAVECMRQSTDLSSSGVPMLRLQSALTACPPKT